MTVLVGEGDDLRLDARAVAGADTLDLPIVQRRAVEGLTEDGVAGLIGIERIAGELTQRRAGRRIEVGELMMIISPSCTPISSRCRLRASIRGGVPVFMRSVRIPASCSCSEIP